MPELEISVQDAAKEAAAGRAKLLDGRTQEEYDIAHIKGAVLLKRGLSRSTRRCRGISRNKR